MLTTILVKAVCVECVFQSSPLLQQCRNALLCLDCAECFVSIWVSTISSWLGAKQVFPFREIRPDCAVCVFQRYAFMVKYSDSAHNVSFTLISVQWVLVDCYYTPPQASAGKPELHESKQHVLKTTVSTFPCLVLHWHARQFANRNFISSCSAFQHTSFFLVSLLHGSFNCHENLPGQLHNWLQHGWFFNMYTQPQSSWTLGFVTLRQMRVISSVTAWTSSQTSNLVTWPLRHTAPTNLAIAMAV